GERIAAAGGLAAGDSRLVTIVPLLDPGIDLDLPRGGVARGEKFGELGVGASRFKDGAREREEQFLEAGNGFDVRIEGVARSRSVLADEDEFRTDAAKLEARVRVVVLPDDHAGNLLTGSLIAERLNAEGFPEGADVPFLRRRSAHAEHALRRLFLVRA